MYKKIIGILTVIMAVLTIINNISDNYILVSGESMLPNLEDGQKVRVIEIDDTTTINRFDIVVAEKEENYNIIKRVIGLPNETVEYKDNHLYINGEPVTEDFIDLYLVKTEDFSITLKENEYFLLGDNRNHSTDSRELGPFLGQKLKFLVKC